MRQEEHWFRVIDECTASFVKLTVCWRRSKEMRLQGNGNRCMEYVNLSVVYMPLLGKQRRDFWRMTHAKIEREISHPPAALTRRLCASTRDRNAWVRSTEVVEHIFRPAFFNNLAFMM